MNRTFTRFAGLAGLTGSIALAALLLAPVLAPALARQYDFLNAPVYGGGTLLLAVFAAGLFRTGKGRAGIAAKVGLVGTIAGLLAAATIIATEIFPSLGWANNDWLWPALMLSVGLAFGGLAVYATAAMIARAIPVWVAVPIAIGGAMFVGLEAAAIVMDDNMTGATADAFNLAAAIAIVLVLVGCGLLGLILALGRTLETPGTAGKHDSPYTLLKSPASRTMPVVVAVIATALLLLAATSLGPQATAEDVRIPVSAGAGSPSGGRPVLIDTDMGIDDVMAILYLLQREDVAVQAITVAGTGLAHCEPGVRNARGLLALAGYTQVPVTCGSDGKPEGGHSFPDEWRRGADGLQGLSLPEANGTDPGVSAPELIVRLADEHSGELSMLALGPLTNLAGALQREPDVVDKLDSVYVMGGAVDVPGNVEEAPLAEWNIYADPRAASAVFAAGLPMTLVPLDATNSVPLDAAFIARLEGDRSTAEADFVYRLLHESEALVTAGDYYFWDPLAAALMTGTVPGAYRSMSLQVVEDGPEAGRTVRSRGGKPVQIADSPDAERFKQTFLDTVNGRER